MPPIIVGSALFITGNIGARTGVVVLPFDHHLIGQLGGAITLVVGLTMLGSAGLWRRGVRMRKRVTEIVVGVVSLMLVTVSCSGATQDGTTAANGSGPSGSSVLGKPAPDFTLQSASGSAVTLSSFEGHRPVLLYFSMGPG